MPPPTPLTLSSFHEAISSTSLRDFYTALHARCASTNFIFTSLAPLPTLLSHIDSLCSFHKSPLPLLYGVPYVLKDNVDCPPHETSAGCAPFSYSPENPAHVVQLLDACGAVCVGKVNMDQFACGLVGTRSPFGTPQNPWHSDYIPGGSSSGSAVAVAIGLCVFAIGTDTAGSGRVPAAMNGVVGFKPTKGIVSARGVVPAVRGLDCVSVFGGCAADVEKVMRVLIGEDNEWWGSRKYDGQCGEVEGLKVGVFEELWFGDLESERLYWEGVKGLEGIGGERIGVDFGVFEEVAGMLYGGGFLGGRYDAVGKFVENGIANGDEGFDEVVSGIVMGGKEVEAWKLVRDECRVGELCWKADKEVWGKVDVIVVPSVGKVATVEEVRKEPVRVNAMLGKYTNFVNLMDYCAVALPVGVGNDGVPRGITVIGKKMKDGMLMKVGKMFEEKMKAEGSWVFQGMGEE